MRLRALTTQDTDIVRTATLENVNRDVRTLTVEDIEAEPRLRAYTIIDTDRGDYGYVAEEEGEPVGVVWCGFHAQGYGFVDEERPEMGVWVHARERRHGLGRLLVGLAQQEARARKLAGLSLSVEAGNDVARHLYDSLTFRPVEGREADGVMVWDTGA